MTVRNDFNLHFRNGKELYYKYEFEENNEILNGDMEIKIESIGDIDTKVTVTDCKSLLTCTLGVNDNSGEGDNFKVLINTDIKKSYIYIVVESFSSSLDVIDIEVTITKDVDSINFFNFENSNASSLSIKPLHYDEIKYLSNFEELDKLYMYNERILTNYQDTNDNLCDLNDIDENNVNRKKCMDSYNMLINNDEILYEKTYSNNVHYLYANVVKMKVLLDAIKNNYNENDVEEILGSVLISIGVNYIFPGAGFVKSTAINILAGQIISASKDDEVREKIDGIVSSSSSMGGVLGLISEHLDGAIDFEHLEIPTLNEDVNKYTSVGSSVEFSEIITKDFFSMGASQGSVRRDYFKRSLLPTVRIIPPGVIEELRRDEMYNYEIN